MSGQLSVGLGLLSGTAEFFSGAAGAVDDSCKLGIYSLRFASIAGTVSSFFSSIAESPLARLLKGWETSISLGIRLPALLGYIPLTTLNLITGNVAHGNWREIALTISIVALNVLIGCANAGLWGYSNILPIYPVSSTTLALTSLIVLNMLSTINHYWEMRALPASIQVNQKPIANKKQSMYFKACDAGLAALELLTFWGYLNPYTTALPHLIWASTGCVQSLWELTSRHKPYVRFTCAVYNRIKNRLS